MPALHPQLPAYVIPGAEHKHNLERIGEQEYDGLIQRIVGIIKRERIAQTKSGR